MLHLRRQKVYGCPSFDDLITGGKPTAVALTDGYHLAFGVAAGLVVLAVLLALATLRTPAASAPDPVIDEDAEIYATVK